MATFLRFMVFIVMGAGGLFLGIFLVYLAWTFLPLILSIFATVIAFVLWCWGVVEVGAWVIISA